MLVYFYLLYLLFSFDVWSVVAGGVVLCFYLIFVRGLLVCGL